MRRDRSPVSRTGLAAHHRKATHDDRYRSGREDDQPTEISEPWSRQFDSFDEFYLATYGMVFRVAPLILHDTSLAEEVTHEVFLELLRGRTHSDPARGALHTWVLTIARHRAVGRVRSVNSARLNDDRFARMDSDRGVESVEEAVHRAAEHDEVREMLAELPDSYEEIIRLIYWNDYSWKEIAEFYGIPLAPPRPASGRRSRPAANSWPPGNTRDIPQTGLYFTTSVPLMYWWMSQM
jgi:RNA polymerase sigma-70 factor (ECF subfamily)